MRKGDLWTQRATEPSRRSSSGWQVKTQRCLGGGLLRCHGGALPPA